MLEASIDNALSGLIDELFGSQGAKNQLECTLAAKTVSATETAISLLDDVVSAVERWKTQFRRRRNAVLPLHALPLDIFHQILEYCLLGNIYSRNYYVSLWKLRSVSVYWMRSIDGLPSVWTSISSSNTPRMVTVALNNSLDFGLDIEFKCRQAKWAREHLLFASKVAPHSKRWRSLTIITDDAPDLSGILSLPAPNLRNLWISCSTESGSGGNLLGGDTMGIRNLYLRKCFLPWETTYLVNLDSLVLSMGVGGAPLMSRLLQILSTSPNLHRLEIESSDMSADRCDPLTVPIWLPKLSRLRLAIPELASSVLLQSIVAPQTRLHLEVHLHEPIKSSPLLPHTMQMAEISTLPRSSCPEINITFGESHMALEYGPINLRVERDYWYSWDPGMPERLEVLRVLFSSLSVETRYHPVRLRFTPDDDSDYQNSYHVLRNLVHLVDVWFPRVTKFTVEATLLDDDTATTKIKESLAPETKITGEVVWPLAQMAALTVEINDGPHDALADVVLQRNAAPEAANITRLSLSQGSISRQAMKQLNDLENLHVKLYWVDVVDREATPAPPHQDSTAQTEPNPPIPSINILSWFDDEEEDAFRYLFDSSS